MKKNVIDKHVHHGHRFEVSLACFESNKCDCCRKVEPGHADPLYKESAIHEPIKCHHLTTRWFPAWRCTCDGVCHGEKFYCNSCKTQTQWFRDHHGNQWPWEFLGIDKSEPNAILCTYCHEEVNKNGDMSIARKFFQRNDFSQMPTYSLDCTDTNERIAVEIHSLLSQFIAAEEAAIRQITPLISITKLCMGNIGSHGNTSCVWQTSKLNVILPNLPRDCKQILSTRRSGNDRSSAPRRDLPSHKF